MPTVPAGATSKSVSFVLRNSADNIEQTGKVASNCTASYWRQGGTRTAITLSDLAAVNSAYSSGGMKEVDSTNMKGTYRLDVPDAAFAASADWVHIEVYTSTSFVWKEKFDLSTTSSAAGIAAAVWDEVLTGATHNVNNSAGRLLRQLVPNPDAIFSGTAQSGSTSTTIKLASGASAVDNFYQWTVVSITGGTGAGQSKVITAYVGSTKVATVDSAWTVTPDATSTFDITPTASARVLSYISGQDPATLVWNEAASGHTTAGSFGNIVGKNNQLVDAGTAQAGSSTSLTLATSASTTTSIYNGMRLYIVSGAGAGQARTIAGYTSGRVASTDRAWLVTPDNTSVYVLFADNIPSVNASMQVVSASVAGNVTGSVGSVVGNVGGTVAGMTAAGWATAFTVNTTKTYADAVAGSLVKETADHVTVVGGITAASVATAVWTDLLAGSDFSTSASIGKLLKDDIDATVSSRLATAGYTTPPTAAAITTAVWTDLLASSDFSTSSSIGKLLKDDIDAAISSVGGGGDTPGTTTLLSRIPSALTITGGGVTLADGVAHGGTPGSSTATLALQRFVIANSTSDPALNITNSSGGAVNFECTGGFGSGIMCIGDPAGGYGFYAQGVWGGKFKSNSGPALTLEGDSSGLVISGDSQHGIDISGGISGIYSYGGKNGISLEGDQGLELIGGDGDGTNLPLTGLYVHMGDGQDGDGAVFTGNGTGKHGITATGGTDGDGFRGVGTGTGAGFTSTPDAVGFGSGGGGGGDVNVVQWGGVDILTPLVPGVPIVDIGYVLGDAATTGPVDANIVSYASGLSPDTLVWNALASGYNIAGSFGSIVQSLVPNITPISSDTLQAADNFHATLALTEPATDGAYVDKEIFISTGPGAGQSRVIVTYVGSTRRATIDENWELSDIPDNTSTYEIRNLNRVRVFAYATAARPDTLVWSAATRTLTAFDFPVSVDVDGLNTVIIEPATDLSLPAAVSVILAAVAGKLTGATTTTVTCFAADDPATARITATVDGNGNRTATVLNPP